MLGYAILNQQEYYFSQRGNTMSKQIHIRLEDSVYDALSEYTVGTGQSVQDCVSGALAQEGTVYIPVNGTNIVNRHIAQILANSLRAI